MANRKSSNDDGKFFGSAIDFKRARVLSASGMGHVYVEYNVPRSAFMHT